MVRIATPIDLAQVAVMMQMMYIELFGDKASSDINDYLNEVFASHINPKHYIYVDDALDGFFLVVDETSPMAPTLKRYNGTRLYIKEHKRKSRLLYNFYQKLFEDFPDGDILGYTEVVSEHIGILNKRHSHIMNVYKLDRR